MFNGAVSLETAIDHPELSDVIIGMYQVEMDRKTDMETAQNAQDVIRRLRGN
jgi:hypothetical protein